MRLQFKVDENLPGEVAELLRSAGHDALTVLDQHMGGASDSKLANQVRSEGRCLLTLDLGFADIRKYPPQDYSGFVVLRLPTQDKRRVLAAIARIIPIFLVEPVKGRLWIVGEEALRIRGEAS